jgi:hypothetical protein
VRFVKRAHTNPTLRNGFAMASIQVKKPAARSAVAGTALETEPNTSRAKSPWFWFVVTAALLLVSGGVRVWRDWQFNSIADQSAACPFPLNEIPTALGRWHAIEGSDAKLDPETARTAGSSDHLIRTYQNDDGETVVVLVLYGLAREVFAHTAEICYPSAGYKVAHDLQDTELTVPGLNAPVPVRSVVFSKTTAGISRYEEVVSTFRHGGKWVPDVGSRWKVFRYQPGMFKIQVQRQVDSFSPETSPSRSLIADLVLTIENRLSRDQKK